MMPGIVAMVLAKLWGSDEKGETQCKGKGKKAYDIITPAYFVDMSRFTPSAPTVVKAEQPIARHYEGELASVAKRAQQEEGVLIQVK